MWGLNPKQHPFKNSVKPLLTCFYQPNESMLSHEFPGQVVQKGLGIHGHSCHGYPHLQIFPQGQNPISNGLEFPSGNITLHWSLNSVVWQGQIQIGSKLKSLCSGQGCRTHVLTQTWHPLHQWLTWTCRTWLGCESSQWTTLPSVNLT